MKNAWNMWIKWKGKGRKVLLAQEDKNLEKNLEENDKNSLEPDLSKRERAKGFLKSLNKVKNTWEKLVLKNSLNDFQSVKN